MADFASPLPTTAPRPHQHLLTLVLPLTDPASAVSALAQIEANFAAVPHEVIAIYCDGTHDAVDAIEALADRPATLRLLRNQHGPALAAAIPLAAGDIVALIDANTLAHLPAIAQMADAARHDHSAILIADAPRAAGRDGLLDWLLAALAGMPGWNPLSGLRVYSADFLDTQSLCSADDRALTLELAVNAQLAHTPVTTFPLASPIERLPPQPWHPPRLLLRHALLAPVVVWSLWAALTLTALVTMFAKHPGLNLGYFANVALPSAATFAFTLAVRRARGRVRFADAFFSLVLLNPFYNAGIPFDPTLLATGILGLMAGAIIAMKGDHLRRYIAVAALVLLLVAVADSFAMLLPPLVIWLILVGYSMAKSGRPQDRLRGFIVLAAAECDLMVFCLACIFAESAAAPLHATLIANIISIADFPLLVLSIVLLALGWRPVGPVQGPRKRKAPPYFAGMLALLIGLLALLLNNLPTKTSGPQSPAGTDQTAFILCLLYTVFALHGPRRLHWLAPPLLLAAALAYIAIRP